MAGLPPANVLLRAAQVSMDQDKPIYLDYYKDSVEKKCCIGVQADNTKYLVKSNEEYTSTIESIFKCETCYIVSTENSLYVVSTDVPVKKILSSTSS
jgi:hypothetical protein